MQDIVLFEALISDLFPDTRLPSAADPQLRQALTGACWAAGLQPEQAFLSKALQLHDTLGVRFGVMLVGPAGGLTALACNSSSSCSSDASGSGGSSSSDNVAELGQAVLDGMHQHMDL
jgi:hypothetical protein